jgi:hypothetical protein
VIMFQLSRITCRIALRRQRHPVGMMFMTS